MRTIEEKIESLNSTSVWYFAKQDTNFDNAFKAVQIVKQLGQRWVNEGTNAWSELAVQKGLESNHRILSVAQLLGLLTKETPFRNGSFSKETPTNVFNELCRYPIGSEEYNALKTEQLLKLRMNAITDTRLDIANYSISPVLFIFEVFWKLQKNGVRKIPINDFYTYVMTCKSHEELDECVAYLLSPNKPVTPYIENYKSGSRITSLMQNNLNLIEFSSTDVSVNSTFGDYFGYFFDGAYTGFVNIMKYVVHNIETYQKVLTNPIGLAVNFLKAKSPIPVGVYSLQKTSVLPSLSPLLAAICTKPFVLLAGISGTGKSRIVRRLAQATDTIRKYDALQDRWDNHNPDNFCLIQVKPNWHNSMDVVGYLSNLNGPHYVLTPFVRFVAQAWINPNIPYFLCLDEMNLAPVEEYFAEFLSAIESRTIDADDHYWTDPIIQPLKNFGEAISRQIIRELLGDKLYHEKQDLEAQFYEHGLTLPPNLVVMGTVNMDETTFSFSRKVLDRAMSIEMNEVDFDAYLNRQSDLVNADLTANNAKFVQRVINGAAYANENFAFEVKEYLTKINQTLENTPFKLGYRAINEALIYVAAAQSFNISVDDALDNFTLMKILSRIEGDSSKLTVSADNAAGGTAARNLLTVLQGVVKGDKSKAKLQQMSAVLERDHFVSYWG